MIVCCVFPSEALKVTPGGVFAIYSKEIHSEGLWYRVKVLKVKGEQVHIEYLDYGDTGTVSTASLRSIPPRFLELPFQVCNDRSLFPLCLFLSTTLEHVASFLPPTLLPFLPPSSPLFPSPPPSFLPSFCPSFESLFYSSPIPFFFFLPSSLLLCSFSFPSLSLPISFHSLFCALHVFLLSSPSQCSR